MSRLARLLPNLNQIHAVNLQGMPEHSILSTRPSVYIQL